MENEPSVNDKLIPYYIGDRIVWIKTVQSYLSYAAIELLLEEDL